MSLAAAVATLRPLTTGRIRIEHAVRSAPGEPTTEVFGIVVYATDVRCDFTGDAMVASVSHIPVLATAVSLARIQLEDPKQRCRCFRCEQSSKPAKKVDRG